MDIDEIIRLNEGLIYKIASKFYGIDKEDLFQAGALGVMKAYKNYKKNGTTKFSTYAYDYIFGEMYQLYNKQSAIKVSKEYLRLYKLIETTRCKLSQGLNRIPSNEELALYLEYDISLINDVIMACSNVYSLDIAQDDERSIYETIPDENTMDLDDKILLYDAMQELTDTERKIISYRYYEDMTQNEVARKLHLNQVKVSRYEKRSLEKMENYSKVA